MRVPDISRSTEKGVGPGGEDLRVYRRLADDAAQPSVTSILGLREWDTTGLDIWKEQNDGTGDNADWKHLLWYTALRGTLAHYDALHPLADRVLWSGEEHHADRDLLAMTGHGQDDDVANAVKVATPADLLYSVMKDQPREPHTRKSFGRMWAASPPRDALKRRCAKDRELFTDWFEAALDAAYVDEILHVERYLFDDTLGAAGQVDLVYRDTAGATVVADLKTSARIQLKHQYQSVFYAGLLENTGVVESVDRLEVWQKKPRGSGNIHTPAPYGSLSDYHTSEDWEINTGDVWAEITDLCSTVAESVDLSPDADGGDGAGGVA